jgi:hypothetical protein
LEQGAGQGPLAAAGVAVCDREIFLVARLVDLKIMNRQLALANAALRSECCRAEAVIRRHAVTRQRRNPRTMRSGGWPGRICFAYLFFGEMFPFLFSILLDLRILFSYTEIMRGLLAN